MSFARQGARPPPQAARTTGQRKPSFQGASSGPRRSGSKATSSVAAATTTTSTGAPARRKISELRFGATTTDNPFTSKGADTAFAAAFSRRDLPCVLATGSVKSKLEWRTPVDDVSFDPVLRLLATGLAETRHPYAFVAQTGFHELLQARDAGTKAAPILADVIGSIRICLTSSNAQVYDAGLVAIEDFARAVGPPLVPHLKRVLGQVAKNMSKPKQRDRLTDVLITLEEHCGPECLKLIKKAVPVYSSVM